MSKAKSDKEITRSSAAEYLTFIAATGEGGVDAVYADENIWLSQKMMGVLYNVETHTINYHLKTIFADSELYENAVIRDFRITAKDGKKYNPHLNVVEFDHFKTQAGLPSFVLGATKWVNRSSCTKPKNTHAKPDQP